MAEVQPPAASPRSSPDATAALLARVLAGERAAIARAISAVENGAAIADALRADLAPHAGRAHVVGITGAPGAGKSTLINALLGAWLERGQRIAIVAVDPSSARTGGAVLGDRIRMGEFGGDDRVFIRSLASRGHLGGLTRTAATVVDLLDAAGFDKVIVETVGTGQSEVEIRTLADTTVVVCPPGLGDAVQATKAGILEIADVLLVTKADLPTADRTVGDLQEMLALRPRGPGWRVPVLPVTATTRTGIPALVDALEAHATTAGIARRRRGARAAPAAANASDAARVARLGARDRFMELAGIEFVEGDTGTVTLRMAVGAPHINFNGTCHGGALFTLADSAFGLACNSRGVLAAAIDAHVTFQVAVREGDMLEARAVEVHRSRRVGVYRVDVTRRGDATLVATFTGTAYITGRPNELPPDAPGEGAWSRADGFGKQ